MNNGEAVKTSIRLGIVGFGEGGSLIAKGLTEHGLREIQAYDPAVAGTSGAGIRRQAAMLDIALAASLNELVCRSNVIFSLVTPSEAHEVARAAAPHLGPGALFVDFNSTVPEAKARSSSVIESVRGLYVDAAVLGSIRAFGHAVPVWAVGSGAKTFRESFTPFGMHIRVLAGEAGTAAAVKLLRSVFTKGLEALGIETLLVAEAFGVRELILQALGDLDEKPMAEIIRLMVTTHPVHALRRLHEVEQAIEMIRKGGLDPVLTNSTRDVFARTVDLDIAEEVRKGKPLGFEEALAMMRRPITATRGRDATVSGGERSAKAEALKEVVTVADSTATVQPVDPGILKGFREVSAASVHEVMGKRGALDAGLRPLWQGILMCGTAFTLRARVGDNLALHQAIYAARAGDVLVADAGGYTEAGMWGDVTTTAAMARGIEGLVIDGAVRDVQSIRQMQFPIFSRGVSMKGTTKKSLGEIGVPVTCGGVTVNPGDVILGDEDGVVVVPKEIAAEVLEAARRKEAQEENIRQQLRAGKTTLELLGFDEVIRRLQQE